MTVQLRPTGIGTWQERAIIVLGFLQKSAVWGIVGRRKMLNNKTKNN